MYPFHDKGSGCLIGLTKKAFSIYAEMQILCIFAKKLCASRLSIVIFAKIFGGNLSLLPFLP